MMNKFMILMFVPLLYVFSCTAEEPARKQSEWMSLFNGKDLGSWQIKINGHELGDNFGNTLRVEDGIMKIVYDAYGDDFANRFGAVYYTKSKFSYYKLRVEYRFVGDVAPGAPEWGLRDSGIQVHCQAPGTMALDQSWPVCVEMNLKGGVNEGERPTGDLCTPGTHVMMNGEVFTDHCAARSDQTIHGDEWVTAELEVRGDEVIRHFVNGVLVAEYSKPYVDESSKDGQRYLEAGNPKEVKEGYISLQSNSHPIEFRKVELMKLNPLMDNS